MDGTAGKTGIEIQAGMSPGQKNIGKLLHALHLDGVGKVLADNMKVEITLDGDSHEEPLYEAHFLECEPGEHELGLAMYGRIGVASKTMGKIFNKNSIKLVVEPGKVTQVRYAPKDGAMRPGHTTTLEIVGTRPA